MMTFSLNEPVHPFCKPTHNRLIVAFEKWWVLAGPAPEHVHLLSLQSAISVRFFHCSPSNEWLKSSCSSEHFFSVVFDGLNILAVLLYLHYIGCEEYFQIFFNHLTLQYTENALDYCTVLECIFHCVSP